VHALCTQEATHLPCSEANTILTEYWHNYHLKPTLYVYDWL